MKVKVVIDRIEDKSLAVLEIEGRMGDFIWPVKYLPPGVHDGSVLNFTIEPDAEAEAEQREKIKKLQEELLERTRKREEK